MSEENAEEKKDAPAQDAPVAQAQEETKESSVELSPKLDKVLKTIEELTALELSELVKGIEDKFGVQAAAPMAMGAVMPGAGAAAGLSSLGLIAICTTLLTIPAIRLKPIT